MKLPTKKVELNKLAKKYGIKDPQFKSKNELEKLIMKAAGVPKKGKRGPGRPPGSGTKKRGPGRPPGSGKAKAAPKTTKKRGPGRPPGSGKKSAPVATKKRGPGRPPGTGKKRGPGRPPASGKPKTKPATTPAPAMEGMETTLKSMTRRLKGVFDLSEMLNEKFPELVKEVNAIKRDLKGIKKKFDDMELAAEPEKEAPPEKKPPAPKSKKSPKKSPVKEEKKEKKEKKEKEESTEGTIEIDLESINSAKYPELLSYAEQVGFDKELKEMKKKKANMKELRARFIAYLEESAKIE